MKRYLIRAVKYFVALCVLCAAIMLLNQLYGTTLSFSQTLYVMFHTPRGLLLPAVGALAPLFRDKKLSLDDDLNNVAPQLSAAFAGLSGDKLERLLKKLLCSQNIVPKSTGEWLTEEQADEIFCGPDVRTGFPCP